MTIVVYVLSSKTTTTSFENLRLVVKGTKDFILPTLLFSALFAIVIVGVACIFIALFVTHRVVGPLYRLEKSIGQIAKGDLTVDIHLRRTDEIKVLAEGLNNMTRQLRDLIAPCQQDLQRLEAALVLIKERLNRQGMPLDEINAILRPCEENLSELKNSLSYFRIS